tara:strand:- start:177 stop:680 length:504 start_codon:yes stop_codon:yes gene_type:complete
MFREPRSSFPDYFIHPSLEIKKSETHGVGVFATADIPPKTMIESAPVVICHSSLMEALFSINDTRHVLQDYPFGWKDGCLAFAHGYGALYNHSVEKCKVVWRPNYELETMEFTTMKEISAGEEIFIKYLPASHQDSLWFESEENDVLLSDVKYEKERKSGISNWKLF